MSVGNGGLLSGALLGMDRVGWSDVPCIAMETVGADCLNASLKAGRIVTLPDITRYQRKPYVIRQVHLREMNRHYEVTSINYSICKPVYESTYVTSSAKRDLIAEETVSS